MLTDIKRIPKWSDRFKYIFQKPGWLPESLGGYRAPYNVDKKTHEKFDLHTIKAINTYVFVQYLVLLVSTALFLLNVAIFEEDLLQKSILALMIIAATVAFGGLFENKTWSRQLEYIRLALSPIIISYYFLGAEFNLLFTSISTIFVVGSIIWLYCASRLISPANSQAK